MNKVPYIITLIVLLSGCGVNFKQLSIADKPLDADVSGGTYTPPIAETNLENGADEKISAVPSILFTDSLPNAWGIEKQGSCKDFAFDEDVKFQGKKSLHLKWKKDGCLWVGWGLSWNNYEPIDYSANLNTLALSFWIKNNGTPQPTVPMIIGIEDYADKGAYTAISGRHLQNNRQVMDSNWVNVILPLSDFPFAATNVNPANIKHLIFSFEGTGDINMDNIKMVQITGGPGPVTPVAENPTLASNKSKPKKQVNSANFKQTTYATLFEDALPLGAWGLERDKCKEVIVIESDKAEGKSALSYKWDKGQGCNWIGFGFSWTSWAPADIARYEKKGALCMKLKNRGKTNEGLPLIIGLEDYSGKSAFLSLDNRFIKTEAYGTNEWLDVIIPLVFFDFKGHNVNASTIKQIIFQGEGEGNLLLDDIKFANYPGTLTNPHNKPDVSLEEVPMLSENSPSSDGVFVGIFTPGQPPAIMNTFAKVSGKKPTTVMWYENWTGNPKIEEINRIHASGCTPHIVWEANNGGSNNTINLRAIIAGEQDAYITKYAQALAKTKGDVHLRIFHEFNGNWYPWSTVLNGKDPNRHIQAWRHIVAIFRKEGATNVKFVWCPNNGGVPNDKENPWNDPYKCYPGSEWVDWVAIDGYNWGENELPGIGSHWAPFREIFENHYIKLAKSFPDKPLMIAEFACNQAGGDKAEWFRTMQADLKNLFPRIKNYNYFNINKETDWRVNSSAEAEIAFKQIMQEPYSRSSAAGLANVIPNFSKEFPDLTDIERTIERLPSAQKRDENYALELAKKSAGEKKTIRVAINNTNMVLDGIVNESEYAGEPMLIDKSTIYLAFDNSFVYIAAQVTDENPLINSKENGDIWNGDALEFAIGFDPEANMDRTEYLGTDFHIGIKCSETPYIWNWSRNRRVENAIVITKKTSKGYELEAKIPITEFDITKFPVGKRISGEAAINNGDNSGRKTQRMWNASKGGFNERPFLWGFLEINN